ncbi:uncharacterized protein LOC130821678 [Amaranthus tricolor]|uniref:uncharacterized protein LOC130821678 n=1 Tax=Amaranthus tricolor TaxID=29722 RepID=UPI002583D4BF|nr:uncharacterized protein LOC130821678 [Amaranthus tricolor]
MVVDDFESDVYINTTTQYDTTLNDESDIHQRENNWELLFPEIVQENVNRSIQTNLNVVGNIVVHQRNESHDSNRFKLYSVDSNDTIFSLENMERDGESDLVLIDQKLISEETNTSIEHYMNTQLENEDDESIGKSTESIIREPPNIQVMLKNEENYDSKRIPSNVFERCDSLIPAEWSTASNESLFSLNVGNASIGRDQALLLSGELKSGPKFQGESVIGDLQEIRKIAGLPKPPNQNQHVLRTPIVIQQEEEKDVSLIKEGKQLINKNVHSTSLSLNSNTSEDSNYSFVFPIFGAERNNLIKSHEEPQNTPQQLNIYKESPIFGSKTKAPRRNGGLFSCFRIFSCNFCCDCNCNSFPSCNSCSCTSCFSCPSCLSCPSFTCSSCCCKSCFSCKACQRFCC